MVNRQKGNSFQGHIGGIASERNLTTRHPQYHQHPCVAPNPLTGMIWIHSALVLGKTWVMDVLNYKLNC